MCVTACGRSVMYMYIKKRNMFNVKVTVRYFEIYDNIRVI